MRRGFRSVLFVSPLGLSALAFLGLIRAAQVLPARSFCWSLPCFEPLF